jgi:uncharacterized protein (UPF0212 family)
VLGVLTGVRVADGESDRQSTSRPRIKSRITEKRGLRCMNYLVVMEAAWVVRDVSDIDDAIGVAISEAGKRLNDDDMDYVEVDVGATYCPACGEPFDSAYVAADTALVGLELEIDVFNAESQEHAERIAKSDIGGALRDVPLKVVATQETGEGDDESA